MSGKSHQFLVFINTIRNFMCLAQAHNQIPVFSMLIPVFSMFKKIQYISNSFMYSASRNGKNCIF